MIKKTIYLKTFSKIRIDDSMLNRKMCSDVEIDNVYRLI